MSRIARKPVFGVSDQVRHKLGCTVTEDGKRLEISDLESRFDQVNRIYGPTALNNNMQAVTSANLIVLSELKNWDFLLKLRFQTKNNYCYVKEKINYPVLVLHCVCLKTKILNKTAAFEQYADLVGSIFLYIGVFFYYFCGVGVGLLPNVH